MGYVTYSDMFQFTLVVSNIVAVTVALLTFASSKDQNNKKK